MMLFKCFARLLLTTLFVVTLARSAHAETGPFDTGIPDECRCNADCRRAGDVCVMSGFFNFRTCCPSTGVGCPSNPGLGVTMCPDGGFSSPPDLGFLPPETGVVLDTGQPDALPNVSIDSGGLDGGRLRRLPDADDGGCACVAGGSPLRAAPWAIFVGLIVGTAVRRRRT